MYEILIADDHPLFRQALCALVGKALPDGVQIAQTDHVQGVFDLVKAHPNADLLLLDLNMPGGNGFEPLVRVRSTAPQLPVVVVSAYEDDQSVRRAIEHGAVGFIPKSSDAVQLQHALQAVLAGDVWFPQEYDAQAAPQPDPMAQAAQRIGELTMQQRKVLQMAATGLLNKQIAHELGTSEATIKAHMTAILRKLGATNRTQAVSIFNRLSLVLPSHN